MGGTLPMTEDGKTRPVGTDKLGWTRLKFAYFTYDTYNTYRDALFNNSQ